MNTAEETKLPRSPTSVGRGSILVGVDSSDGGQHALRWSATLAGRSGKSIILAHADSPWLGLGMSVPPLDYEAFKAASAKTVKTWAKTLDGVLEETRIIEDTPAEGLTLLATETKPSLVVLGAHPRHNLTPHILGSTTTKVLHTAEYPTAVIPTTATVDANSGGLVVGVDGSPSSMRALLWAADLGNLLDVSVYAVCAFPFEAYAEKPQLADLEGSDPVGDTLDALRLLATRITNETGRDITSDVLIGHPAERLMDVAIDSYALLVGKSGYASYREDTLGSTTRSCATHSEVPVIVIP